MLVTVILIVHINVQFSGVVLGQFCCHSPLQATWWTIITVTQSDTAFSQCGYEVSLSGVL